MNRRKVFVGILIFFALTIAFAFSNKSDAAGGLGKVKIESARSTDGVVKYKHQLYSRDGANKTINIWKLVTCTQNDKGDIIVNNPIQDLYCLRAGLGFTQEPTGGQTITSVENRVVEYDSSITLSKLNFQDSYKSLRDKFSSTAAQTNIPIFKASNSENFYAVLWILDNMILEGATNQDVEDYLLEKAGYTADDLEMANNQYNLVRNLLTREDIEVIQQLAIWYFTNDTDAKYHPTGTNLSDIYLSVTGDSIPTFNSDSTYTDPEDGIEKPLYQYEYNTYADIYDQIRDITNPANGEILVEAGQYGTMRQEHAVILYKYLIDNAKTAAREAVRTGTYNLNRYITIYYNGKDIAGQQPIVRVEENKEEADIALRKFISKKGDTKLTGKDSREPIVDTSNFNISSSTAIYNHIKKPPVSVKLNENVTYTIRLYNEGEIPTHITQVKDYLPPYLYINADKVKGEWEPDTDADGTKDVMVTTQYCKIVNAGVTYGEPGDFTYEKLLAKSTTTENGEKVVYLKDVLIPAAKRNEEIATGTNRYTLSYVDIEITCQVKDVGEDKVPYDEAITNIAEITGMTDKDGNLLEDRDSNRDIPTGNVKVPHKDTNPDYSKLPTYKDDESNQDYVPGQEDDDDFDKVIIKKPEVDLALRKFISAIGNPANGGKNYYSTRQPTVDTAPLRNNEETANYNHSKEPLPAEIGDIVTYTIRIYNEGEVNGKVTQIKDYVDKSLKYMGANTENKWWTEDTNFWTENIGTNYNTIVSNTNCKVIRTGRITKGVTQEFPQTNKTLNDIILPAYDKVTDTISFLDVEVHFQVQPVDTTIKLTNIAEITEEKDENDRPVIKDRDSEPGNVDVPPDKDLPKYPDLPTYKDDEIEKEKPYIPGQQDDDDFEKVVVKVKEIDLSLRKFISSIDGDEISGREPTEITDKMDKLLTTTAEYKHEKDPKMVKRGSRVIYTIRVYNEGDLNAFVSEITDYLPKYLDYIEGDPINEKFGWDYNSTTREAKTEITAKNNEEGNELYKDRKHINGENVKLLAAYDGNKKLDYIDVQIACKVNDEALGKGILTNIAEITKMADETGKDIKGDRDSQVSNARIPENETNPNQSEYRPNYTGGDNLKKLYFDEKNVIKVKDGVYYPGQQDDDDFEKVQVKPDFDLALRKFITGVNNTPINDRYPEVTYENGKLVYKHTKEPVDVVTGDTVIYTIRIFNEGEADGWANEITDDMPEGLEFLPDNEINKEYRWKMLDAEQKETADVEKAKYIITDYLSEDQEKETERNNMLKAFDKEVGVTKGNPDYRDVKLAFKVTYKATTAEESKRILVNTAQISEDSDDDIDSKPNRDTPYDPEGPNEDDIDYDNVKVKYFDLSLLKWVSQTKVKLSGKDEIITDTGHTAETSKNEAPVKIEIPEKEIKTIVIKYVYTIQITNEGEIEGYATEIKDYIPEGLRFDAKDNEKWNWKILEDGIVTTDYLKNTLLKPGESATVPIVLTWINNGENLGQKVNLAEISKDKNDSDSPDVDSTPDNKVPDEDDIDDAPVILAVKTGGVKIYIGLIAIILITFGSGISLIKKYVLE